MLYVVFAVKDLAAQAFGRPMYMASTGVAVRGFRDEVNRAAEDNHMNRYPADFELYDVGTYDDSTGLTTPPDGGAPRLVMRAVDAKEA